MRRRPWLLDLCCGQGGAAWGYSRAGFDVLGVDIAPQPRYPFPFIQGDALVIGRALLESGRFSAVHMSWPCQRFSDLAGRNGNADEWPDLIAPGRQMVEKFPDIPYVIENVEGAPLRDPVMLCGTMFPELRVYRHRLFETNWPLDAPPHREHRELTFTHDKRKGHYGQSLDLSTMRVQVTGGGNAPVWAKARAMGIDWMTGAGLNEAIPPAYSEWVGWQLLGVVIGREVAA